MNRSVLVGLLALQVLIVCGVLAWNLREPPKPEQFFDFTPEEITKLQVVHEDTTIIVENTAEDVWQLDDGKPADGDKVTRILEKLADASTGWPVATSTSTAERFEVTEDTFQRHLTLYVKDDVVADAYFGTSPSFRLTHVSDVDGGPVYSIEFSNYELGEDKAAWLDKNLLKPEGDLTQLVHEGQYTMNKVEDDWVVETGEGVEVDSDLVQNVANRVENLTVYTISDDAELPEEATASLRWTDDAGEAKLDLFYFEEDDEWVATSSRVVGQYGISTYIAKDMAQTLEELLFKPEEEESESDSDAETDVILPLDIGHEGHNH